MTTTIAQQHLHYSKPYPETDSGNTSNTSSTSTASTETCASSIDSKQQQPPAGKLTVGATGTDFTSKDASDKPDQLLFTKKAITRSRPSSNQLSALVASQSSASHTSSTSSSASSVASFRDTFQEGHSNNSTTVSPSHKVAPGSVKIGAQFPFKSTNYVTSRNPSPIRESNLPASAKEQHEHEHQYASDDGESATTMKSTSPEKAKRFTSENVLPTLCVRTPVKLLGIHRTASTIDTGKLQTKAQHLQQQQQQQPIATVSLPASPTSSGSMQGFAKRNGSLTSLNTVGTGSMVQPPRQLRSPKTPLYLPSVLRRTVTAEKLNVLATASLPGSPNSNRSSSSSSSSPSFGAPSRKHWKSDYSRRKCPVCADSFSLFTRRHHCRKCGDVFCERDSSQVVRLDQNCEYNVLGTSSRACKSCHAGWVEYLNSTSVAAVCEPPAFYSNFTKSTPAAHRAKSAAMFDDFESGSESDAESVHSSHYMSSPRSAHRPQLSRMSSTATTNYTEAELSAAAATHDNVASPDPMTQSVAGSVPANWSWSTF